MKQITEYVFDSLIKEYLLSKSKKQTSDEYFIVWPSFNIYEFLDKQHSDKMVRTSIDYWILSESELLNMAKNFSKETLHKDMKVYRIPSKYDEITIKDAIVNRDIKPEKELNQINIDKILCKL